MEFTFTPIRVVILVALLAGFWFLGGYDFPVGEFAGLRRAWFYSVLMFVLGSVSATVVDHWVGNIDRSNLRFLYIVLGVLCIGGSFMYQNVLNERVKMGGKETIEAE